MSYGWLVYELARADLAGETGAGETGAEQHVVPPGYRYPDLDGCIICYFVLQPPDHRGNDG